jgi:hypothetical protein
MGEMKDEFVSFEQAKALKELGYNNVSPAEYDTNGRLWSLLMDTGVKQELPAPTWNQAFKFFRDKGFHAEIIACTDKYNKPDGRYQVGIFNTYYDPFDSYEEAQSAALNQLIELCKNTR